MTKKNKPVKHFLKRVLFLLFIIAILTLDAYAQDSQNINPGVDIEDTIISKMNVITFNSEIAGTHLNTVYNYENNEFEFGISSVFINGCLGDGMKLEIQTNPKTGSGMLMFTMIF